MLNDTNDWNFFLGHKIRVAAAQCHKGTFIKHAKQPTVWFPSRGPQGVTEKITLTAKPHIVAVEPLKSGARRIVWQFSVSQKVFELPFAQNFDIRYATTPVFNQLCSVGGACDCKEQDW